MNTTNRTLKELLAEGQKKLDQHQAEWNQAFEKQQLANQRSIAAAWQKLLDDLKPQLPEAVHEWLYASDDHHDQPAVLNNDAMFDLRQVMGGMMSFPRQPHWKLNLFVYIEQAVPVLFQAENRGDGYQIVWGAHDDDGSDKPRELYYQVPSISSYTDDDDLQHAMLTWDNRRLPAGTWYHTLDIALAAAVERWSEWRKLEEALHEKNRPIYNRMLDRADKPRPAAPHMVRLVDARDHIGLALENLADPAKASANAQIAIAEVLYVMQLTNEERNQ